MPTEAQLPLPTLFEEVAMGVGETALTPREREIAWLIGHGYRNAEIAHRLGIKKHTVKRYVSALRGKLGLRGRPQIAVWAFQQGLVPVGPTRRPDETRHVAVSPEYQAG
jgi:DNA-binding CsgD family transcriptional regulator